MGATVAGKQGRAVGLWICDFRSQIKGAGGDVTNKKPCRGAGREGQLPAIAGL